MEKKEWITLVAGCLIVLGVGNGCDGKHSSDDETNTSNETNETLQCLQNEGYGVIVLRYEDNSTQVWLDRDLGAKEAADEANNTNAYGDLYEWGRNADGHQRRESNTTDTLANGIHTTNGLYINTQFDWVQEEIDDSGSQRSEAWGDPNSDNQVCPCGFIVASVADFKKASDANKLGELKIVDGDAGYRSGDGDIVTGGETYWWVRDHVPDAGYDDSKAYYIWIDADDINASFGYESYEPNWGGLIRCIHPDTSIDELPEEEG
jgi:hypothetical protein